MFRTKNLKFQDFITYNDISINENSITFITGPSGSGKSTLLRLFNMTLSPSSGEIFYKNLPLNSYESISLRKKIKLISQTSFLFSGTIRENFDLFYSYCDYKKNSSDEDKKNFLSLTEAHFDLDASCDNLSGGEKQRVYLAICLSMDGEVFMLDEPTSALDSGVAHKVLANIINYIKSTSKTLIVISHDEVLTNSFGENIINLNKEEING